MAEWLRRQTRNLLGSPAQVRILLLSLFGCYLRKTSEEQYSDRYKINMNSARSWFRRLQQPLLEAGERLEGSTHGCWNRLRTLLSDRLSFACIVLLLQTMQVFGLLMLLSVFVLVNTFLGVIAVWLFWVAILAGLALVVCHVLIRKSPLEVFAPLSYTFPCNEFERSSSAELLFSSGSSKCDGQCGLHCVCGFRKHDLLRVQDSHYFLLQEGQVRSYRRWLSQYCGCFTGGSCHRNCMNYTGCGIWSSAGLYFPPLWNAAAVSEGGAWGQPIVVCCICPADYQH